MFCSYWQLIVLFRSISAIILEASVFYCNLYTANYCKSKQFFLIPGAIGYLNTKLAGGCYNVKDSNSLQLPQKSTDTWPKLFFSFENLIFTLWAINNRIINLNCALSKLFSSFNHPTIENMSPYFNFFFHYFCKDAIHFSIFGSHVFAF